jgi:hypothetical protein
MTKLRLLQQLREAVTFDKYGSLASGCGLVLNNVQGYGIDYDDFERIRVFVDYHAFVAYVAMQFESYLEEWGDMNLNDLYDGDDDDTITNKIKKVTGKKQQKKPSECENINELSKLKHWDEFVEKCWIADNFKN